MRRGRHLCMLFFLCWGRARSNAATRSSFTERSGALACDFGQQNDDRQADEPEQNANRDPTHGFGSLSVMGRFRRMRRLCNVLHCSILSKKRRARLIPCTWRRRWPFWEVNLGDFWGVPRASHTRALSCGPTRRVYCDRKECLIPFSPSTADATN